MEPLSDENLKSLKEKNCSVRFSYNANSRRVDAFAVDQLKAVVATARGATKQTALQNLVHAMSTPPAKKADKKKVMVSKHTSKEDK